MGTTLTGTTPQDTYDSLIKVTDNGPLSGTAKYLSDGLGNDSVLALSTGNIGIGTTSPSRNLHILGGAGIGTVLKLEAGSGAVTYLQLAYNGATNAQSGYISYDSSANMGLFTNDTERMRITSAGSVLVGTASSDLTRNMIVAGTAGIAVQYAGNAGTYFDIAPAAANGAVTLTADARTGAYPDMIFRTSAAEQVRITSGGVLQLTQGQIKFPATQVASADPNTLDDYEEGTFTATLKGSTTDPTTPVTTTGRYTKIGDVVSLRIAFTAVDTTGAAGDVSIIGLPFTASGIATGSAVANLFGFGGRTSIASYINTGTNLSIFASADGGSFGDLQHSAGANRWLVCAITYFV